jgi:hypothetical protein
MFRKVLAAAVLAVSLAGCAGGLSGLSNIAQTVSSTVSGVSEVEVNRKAVYTLASTFDALQVTATNYMALCRDYPKNATCNRALIQKQIIPAIRSGRIARNSLMRFARDNPGKLGTTGAYNALTASVATLQGIYAQYGIGK